VQAPVQCTRQLAWAWHTTAPPGPTEKSQLAPRWQTRELLCVAERLHRLPLSQRAAHRSPQLPEQVIASWQTMAHGAAASHTGISQPQAWLAQASLLPPPPPSDPP